MGDHYLLSVPQGGLPMRPPLWHPPIELSTAEHAIMKRIRRAKLFGFLRQHRHALFADAFQQELMRLYKDQPQGQPPVPPAQLALATLLQAYTQVSDDEVIEVTTMDRRWQLARDCAGQGVFRHPQALRPDRSLLRQELEARRLREGEVTREDQRIKVRADHPSALFILTVSKNTW